MSHVRGSPPAIAEPESREQPAHPRPGEPSTVPGAFPQPVADH